MANDAKPKKKYTNRAREIEYKIRLTEDEFNFLRTQKIASGCRTRRDFIMQLARNGYIFNCNNLIPELVKQGTNLNQIAKKINTIGPDAFKDNTFREQFTATLKEVQDVWALLSQLKAVPLKER